MEEEKEIIENQIDEIRMLMDFEDKEEMKYLRKAIQELKTMLHQKGEI